MRNSLYFRKAKVARKTQRKGQISFALAGIGKPGDCFGGSLLKNSNAKTKRPLESKLPIHLVLSSTKSTLRLPKTFKVVDDILAHTAKKHGVRIYQAANVGNHLHLVLKIRSPHSWAGFIRELTGRIAQVVSQLIQPPEGQKFWRQRPFTRIVRGWQKAFKTAKAYVHLNRLEAEGFISRKDTKTLKDLRMIWAGG